VDKKRGTKRRGQSERDAPMKPARASGARAAPVGSGGARDAENGPQKRAVSVGQADAKRVLHRGMTPPDYRPRHEKLMELLEYAHVIGASPAESKLDGFVCAHGRNPTSAEGKALGLGPELVEEESYPPFHECRPRDYLETVAEKLRTESELVEPLAKLPDWGGPQVIERFFQRWDEMKRRRQAQAEKLSPKDPPLCGLLAHARRMGRADPDAIARAKAAKPSPKDLLLCGLLALGLPAATAHDWLRGLPDERARRWHLGYFVAERCLLPCAGWGRACKIKTKDLYGAYLRWCEEEPGRLHGEEPFTMREFSSEILNCGGVTEWRTAKARGFSGIALR